MWIKKIIFDCKVIMTPNPHYYGHLRVSINHAKFDACAPGSFEEVGQNFALYIKLVGVDRQGRHQ